MLGLQLVLFCLLYIGMVKIAVKDSGLNCLYFYKDSFVRKIHRIIACSSLLVYN